MIKPSAYPRRVLVCVTGLTPQVVTETLCALTQLNEPWIPTELHVLTTAAGARRVGHALLPEGNDQFRRLCLEHDLHGVRFCGEQIHVLTTQDGHALEDIRTQDDNLAMADAILGFIAGVASDDDCAMHVSLAGGRKSMGFFAGYAVSLYGRPQDRLSHVLVPAQFETNSDFFFPPRMAKVILADDGDVIESNQARIDLADIPFVRLRDRLPARLLSGGRFADAVAAAQRLDAAPSLRVSLSRRTATCAGVELALSTMQFAIYAWHAHRRCAFDDPGVNLSDFEGVDSALRRELHQFGCALYPNAMSAEGDEWRKSPWNRNTADHSHGQWLSEHRARINRHVQHKLGEEGRRIYGINAVRLVGRRTAHRLDLSREYVEIS
jgi:CRISPR-associated protein (TIGR02584 family)